MRQFTTTYSLPIRFRDNSRPAEHPTATTNEGSCLWDNHESATVLVTFPRLLNIREGNAFRLHMKISFGTERHYLLQRVDQDVPRRNSGSPHNRERRAAEYGGRKRNR